MKTKNIFPWVLLLGILAPAAMAQQLPVMTVALTEIDVAGVPAYGANTNPATNSGNPLNGGNAPYGTQLTIWALATGTAPAGGFTYAFYANGEFIGTATPTPNFSQNYAISWTPPQPGVYFFSVIATDGLGDTANSLAIEFFATGIQIVGPPPNSIVPVGSSVVIQAATSVPGGAVASVSFFDQSGARLLGSSRTFPYSIIYTPPGASGATNVISAVSYKADGTVAFTSATQTILMTAAVGPIPVVTITTPVNVPVGPPSNGPATIPIPDYQSNPGAFIPVNVNASSPQGNIQQVQLYINGVLFQTVSTFPYTFQWQPKITGTYNLTALAYDDKNNVIATTTSTSPTLTPAPTTVIVGSLPSVAITSPSDGGSISGGGPSGGTATITASASDTNVTSLGVAVGIENVQFFQDGNLVFTAISPTTPGGDIYSATFTPKQNIDPTTMKPIPSLLTAVATDNLGFSASSVAVSVSVTVGGSSTTTVVGTVPTISLTAPVNAGSVVVNTQDTISANAQATNTPGNITQVAFLVDSTLLQTVTSYPYNATWTPTALGTYTLSAQATDNVGNVTTSAPITVTVVTQPPPSVTVTSPASGSMETVGSTVTVNATASSPDGTIKQVQFYANGVLIGTSTTPPYSVTFTPTSTGVYTFTAIATDNSNSTTPSGANIVLVTPAAGGVGTVEYFGNYQGVNGDNGTFAYSVVDGSVGTFIGYSVNSITHNTSLVFYPDLAVSSGGGFAAPAVNKVVPVSGTASATGVMGTLNPGSETFIGALTQVGSVNVGAGFYSGTFIGQAASSFTAIVGADGSIMVYVSEGTFTDVGNSTVDSSGHFSITTATGNTVSGVLSTSTGFMSGTLAGGPGGSFTAALDSGGTFSDGVLSNLSTRGAIGSGANIMIGGFVIGGTASKQLLIRADGPALAAYGVTGAIGATQLNVYGTSSSTVPVASNTGWSSSSTNASQVAAADLATGAFALVTGSADSALVATLPPGAYTAQVSGVGSDTGVGLLEVYDMSTLPPFTANKLINVSTRINVGTGTSVGIVGFNITGSTPKRLLIRGAGPGLAALGVSGALAAPHLQLKNVAGGLIRENYSWAVGNDAGLVSAAETATGAFMFASGSADSAILIVLPPGTYTAELSGTATGVGLVEVYEVP
jgi:hypothetical protein